MDYFTKWPEEIPIPDEEASTVAEELFPVCYLQHTSNIQPVRHAFQTSTSQQSSQCPQSTRLHVTNVEVKNHASTVTSHLLSPQYMSCFPALACTQSGETNTLVTTASATVFPFGNVNVGNTGNIGHAILKTSFTSQPSQPSVCIQQSFMQLQTASVTLPPVYVSITSSTQSPATRTHAGGHVAAQFSSSRSQSLPVSSSSGILNHSLNSGTPFLGYTVYAPPMQSIPPASPLTTITINQNTASAQPSQFAPAYVSAFQVLPPNVPLVANIGSNAPPLSSVIRTQYPAPISSVSKVPLSFPLVKQTSDPGIGEHVTLASGKYSPFFALVIIVGIGIDNITPFFIICYVYNFVLLIFFLNKICRIKKKKKS
ncbi:hypothetical protein AVEN_165250-1 [Araneus ventricosus]|uniref:Uncharacterized protein n=1 Tax=Araneus ventricosus TaxID=182803 RepID=A0A4Y2ATG2_ARAVE|nr:hypothetical protein AVEN_165250-1 [Araneus ventricosus]